MHLRALLIDNRLDRQISVCLVLIIVVPQTCHQCFDVCSHPSVWVMIVFRCSCQSSFWWSALRCKKTIDTNCGRLYNKAVLEVPWEATLCLRKVVATASAVILIVEVDLLSLLYRSIIAIAKRFSYIDLAKKPSLLIATKSRGPFGGNSCVHLPYFWEGLNLRHDSHLFTQL